MIAPWIPVTVVPTSSATVAIETFITELSSAIRNWPGGSVSRITWAPAAAVFVTVESLTAPALQLLGTAWSGSPGKLAAVLWRWDARQSSVRRTMSLRCRWYRIALAYYPVGVEADPGADGVRIGVDVIGVVHDGPAGALERIRAGEASALLVGRLADAAGSLRELVELLDWLDARGGDLIALDVGLDTATRAGAHVAGRCARSSAGTAAAGRPAARSPRACPPFPELADRIRALRGSGESLQAIAMLSTTSAFYRLLAGGDRWRPSSVQTALELRSPRRQGPACLSRRPAAAAAPAAPRARAQLAGEGAASAREAAAAASPRRAPVTGVIEQFGALGVFLLMVPESACIPVPSEVTLLFFRLRGRPGLDEPPARRARRDRGRPRRIAARLRPGREPASVERVPVALRSLTAGTSCWPATARAPFSSRGCCRSRAPSLPARRGLGASGSGLRRPSPWRAGAMGARPRACRRARGQRVDDRGGSRNRAGAAGYRTAHARADPRPQAGGVALRRSGRSGRLAFSFLSVDPSALGHASARRRR